MDRIGPLEPGARDQSVVIQQAADSVGGSRFPVETFSALATVWMQRDDLSGREQMHSQALGARVDTRWVMAYRSDMDPHLVDVPKKRRLLHHGRPHDIVAARVLGRRDGIELTTVASTKVPA